MTFRRKVRSFPLSTRSVPPRPRPVRRSRVLFAAAGGVTSVPVAVHCRTATSLTVGAGAGVSRSDWPYTAELPTQAPRLGPFKACLRVQRAIHMAGMFGGLLSLWER